MRPKERWNKVLDFRTLIEQIKPRNLRKVSWIISIIIFFSALVFVVIKLWLDRAIILEALNTKIIWTYFLVSLLLVYSSFGLHVLLWKKILLFLGVQGYSYKLDFRLYAISLLGALLPGRIWSIASRSSMYMGQGVRLTQMISGGIIENIVISLAALEVYLLGILINPDLQFINPAFVIIIVLSSFLFLHPKVYGRIVIYFSTLLKIDYELTLSSLSPSRLFKWVLVEGIVIISGALAQLFFLKSMSLVTLDHSITLITAYAAGTFAGTLLFFLPGALIIRQGTMSAVLTTVFPLTTSVIIVVMLHMWTIGATLLLVSFVILFIRNDGHQRRFNLQ